MPEVTEQTAMMALRREPTPERLAAAQRQFQEASEPIRRIIADIYAVTMPGVIVLPDGAIHTDTVFTPEQQKAYDNAQEMLRDLHRQCFAEFLK